VREDSVADFLDPPLWPAFNLADIAIVLGVVLFAYQLSRGKA
jgi:lipoprotein signal peptidase